MKNFDTNKRGGTMCLSKAGLAEGTNANTIKTAAPNGAGIDFMIHGKLYHLADGDNIAMTACATQAALTSCLYLVSVNAAGTVKITKGTEQLTANIGVGKASLVWPECPENECPIGGFRIDLVSTATFTSGSTDLSASNVTDTWWDFGLVPNEVLVA
jgi:hypothetical protein